MGRFSLTSINACLLVIVTLCALSVINANHNARKLYTALDREQSRTRELEVEWGQLQLEQQTWAAHARIENIARQRLGMKLPPPERTLTLGGRR